MDDATDLSRHTNRDRLQTTNYMYSTVVSCIRRAAKAFRSQNDVARDNNAIVTNMSFVGTCIKCYAGRQTALSPFRTFNHISQAAYVLAVHIRTSLLQKYEPAVMQAIPPMSYILERVQKTTPPFHRPRTFHPELTIPQRH